MEKPDEFSRVWICSLFFDQRLPKRENIWGIDGEHMNRDAADRCSAGQDRARPLEVFACRKPLLRVADYVPEWIASGWPINPSGPGGLPQCRLRNSWAAACQGRMSPHAAVAAK
jgi:hypothetical protein